MSSSDEAEMVQVYEEAAAEARSLRAEAEAEVKAEQEPDHCYHHQHDDRCGAVPVPCCDMHNRHCEPTGDLCCDSCTERAHDMFPIRHGDSSACVLEVPDGQ